MKWNLILFNNRDIIAKFFFYLFVTCGIIYLFFQAYFGHSFESTAQISDNNVEVTKSRTISDFDYHTDNFDHDLNYASNPEYFGPYILDSDYKIHIYDENLKYNIQDPLILTDRFEAIGYGGGFCKECFPNGG